MKKIIMALVSISAVTTLLASTIVMATDYSEWKAESEFGHEYGDLDMKVAIRYENSKWVLAEGSCREWGPRCEEIIIDPRKKTVYLGSTISNKNNNISGYSAINKITDAKELLAAFKEADVLPSLEGKIYRNTFYAATTYSDLKEFVAKYQGNDPDLLIPEANKRLPLLEKEEAARQAAQAAENKKEAARQAVENKKEAARQAAENKKFVSFRKKLAEGIETNCGPVIEAKAKLVKVAFAVSNYGTEHWIRRDEIFPSGYGCSFVNGQYQAPQQ